MELKRFFVDSCDVSHEKVIIRGDEFDHLSKVLRLKKGFKIIASANDGKDIYCTIEQIDKSFAVAAITEIVDNDCATITPVSLFFALPKGDKIDFVIQKAVELGVSEIVPFQSSFVAEDKFRYDRLQKILTDACKQCGRSRKPVLKPLISFFEAVELAVAGDNCLVAYERESDVSLSTIEMVRGKKLSLVVGSEGGFSEAEAAAFVAAGAKTFSLGRRILRCETACVAVTAIAMFRLGELDI